MFYKNLLYTMLFISSLILIFVHSLSSNHFFSFWSVRALADVVATKLALFFFLSFFLCEAYKVGWDFVIAPKQQQGSQG